jgi:hypothetical protein
VGTCYVLRGGGSAGYSEPHSVWFGFASYAPPSTNTIYVSNLSSDEAEIGNYWHPFHTIAAGVFATVPGDEVTIDGGIGSLGGTYHEETTFDRACTLTTSRGTVTIQP